MTDLSSMNVESAVRILSRAYISLLKSSTPVASLPSVMLWGPPGVGKSQGIREIGARIEEETGKQVVITDVRLLLFNPVDLRGIPTANADRTLAVWLKPAIFQMDLSDSVVNILFLDEISAAPPSVQAAAYQITLDRMVGEHKLPDNCIVIAAGNRITDRSVAYNMPKALANRLCHIEIESDHKSWHNWAVSAGVHPIVLGFLDYNPSMLMMFDSASEGLAFPTPRSWEMVSNILNYVSENVDEVFPMIAGCIGDSAAFELRTWSEIYSKIPSVEQIFKGNSVEVPVRPQILFALSAEFGPYAEKHHSTEELSNAIGYASRLPFEFRDKIFSDFLQIKKIRRQLKNNQVYNDWFVRSDRDWEDYGL